MSAFQGSSEILHQVLTSALHDLDRSAFVAPDGTAIFVHTSHAQDLATLPQAAALCHRYLKLEDGDVALTNDPYSGGTCLSDFTLVRGVRLLRATGPIDFLIVSRLTHEPKLPFAARLDEEGVRVPPTPLVMGSQFNRELLTAIASHPLAPKNLFESIAAGLESIERSVARMRAIANDPRTLLSSEGIKTYLEDSHRVFESLMARLPLGNALVTAQISSGETLKLQLKISEDHVLFDFAGTDSSKHCGLTDLVTFGACWAALVGSLDAELPLNAGTFQSVQVSAPTKTMLSVSAPTCTTRGMSEGIAAVGLLVLQALTRLRPQMQTAPAPLGEGRYQVVFKDDRRISLRPAPGRGARADRAGSDAWSFLQGGDRTSTLETLDTRHGIELLSLGLRKGSGGNGKFRGGQGMTIGLKAKEDCELLWHDPSLGRRYEGLSGGRAGAHAAIEVVRQGSGAREEFVEMSGKLSLAAGDDLYLLAGGGGGYGEPED